MKSERKSPGALRSVLAYSREEGLKYAGWYIKKYARIRPANDITEVYYRNFSRSSAPFSLARRNSNRWSYFAAVSSRRLRIVSKAAASAGDGSPRDGREAVDCSGDAGVDACFIIGADAERGAAGGFSGVAGGVGAGVRRRKKPVLMDLAGEGAGRGGSSCGSGGGSATWSRLFENLAEAVLNIPSDRLRSAMLGPGGLRGVVGSDGTGGGEGIREL